MASDLFGAIVDKSQIYQVIRSMLEGNEVVAIVAPSFVGQFGKDVTVPKFLTAMKQLGFADVVEVAVGADICTIEEARDFMERRRVCADKHLNFVGVFLKLISQLKCFKQLQTIFRLFNPPNSTPMEGVKITAGDEIRWYYMGEMHNIDVLQALTQTDYLLRELAEQADGLDTFDMSWVEGDVLYPDDDIPAPVLSRFLRSLDWQPMEDITTEIFNRSGYQEVARLVLGDSTMHFYEVPDTPEEAVVIHSGGTDYFYTVLNGFRGWLTGDGRYLARRQTPSISTARPSRRICWRTSRT